MTVAVWGPSVLQDLLDTQGTFLRGCRAMERDRQKPDVLSTVDWLHWIPSKICGAFSALREKGYLYSEGLVPCILHQSRDGKVGWKKPTMGLFLVCV